MVMEVLTVISDREVPLSLPDAFEDKKRKREASCASIFVGEMSKVSVPCLRISKKKKREVACVPDRLEVHSSTQRPANHIRDVTDIVPQYCPQAVINWSIIGSDRKSKSGSNTLRVKQHLVSVGWRIWYIRKQKEREELRYTSPSGKNYTSLVVACKACVNEGFVQEQTTSTCERVHIEQSKILKAENRGFKPTIGKGPPSVMKNSTHGRVPGKKLKFLENTLLGESKGRVQRSCKRSREAVVPSSHNYIPQTVISYLIENDVVLPRAKVYYVDKKEACRMGEGRLTREGIKCNCCQKIFPIKKFESHVGSKSIQPDANIFLEDGRSLIQCQKQMVIKLKLKAFQGESHKKNKPYDSECSICHEGGTLLLCDRCPSAFHLNCVGLEVLPEGDWFCLGCQCGICHQSGFDEHNVQFTDKTRVHCDQCAHEYHVGCIRDKKSVKFEHRPKGNWFCSKMCGKIFRGLHELLGKPFPAGRDDLTVTVLKAVKFDDDDDTSDGETAIKDYCKLKVALGVMHECFFPIKDSYSNTDVVEDVLFNRWSELKRLNFLGFYTVLLERGDELISVATFRVHGRKVAEIPLVATRFQHRRQGMCGVMMDLLENKLSELGVERLVLPAISQTLDTWTKSFGFSEMATCDRLRFLEYPFLDFQKTIMCQKLLRMPSKKSMDRTGFMHVTGVQISPRESSTRSDSSTTSELIQD